MTLFQRRNKHERSPVVKFGPLGLYVKHIRPYIVYDGKGNEHNLECSELVWAYSGSQSHTTRRGRASCSLWYGPVANVCD